MSAPTGTEAMDLDLATGDLLLLKDSAHSNWVLAAYGWLIRMFTASPYTHVAMVLRDPTWIRADLTGLFVYESSTEPQVDPEDHERKLGVQLTPIDEFLAAGAPTVMVRKLDPEFAALLTVEKCVQIHDDTHNTLYDFFPGDLLRAALKVTPDRRRQHTDCMFCSALVAFMCVRFGLVESDVDWSEVTPGDLSSTPSTPIIRWTAGTPPYGEDQPLQAGTGS